MMLERKFAREGRQLACFAPNYLLPENAIFNLSLKVSLKVIAQVL